MYQFQRIKDLREDNDLPQKEVAAVLGITVQQYSLYERGDREIPLHHFITLSKFYNVTLDYLAGLTNNNFPHHIAQKTPTSFEVGVLTHLITAQWA